MNKKSSFSPPVVGGSSLLVIFAVLCLTVFALLSLSTVRADARLSDASVSAVSAYYAADCAAEEILARLRAGELPDGVTESGGVYSYVCPISDTQQLEVEVELSLGAGGWTIRRWQAVSIAEMEETELIDVWDGEFFIPE